MASEKELAQEKARIYRARALSASTATARAIYKKAAIDMDTIAHGQKSLAYVLSVYLDQSLFDSNTTRKAALKTIATELRTGYKSIYGDKK